MPVLTRSITGGKRKRTVHAVDLKKVYTQTYIYLNSTSLYYIGVCNTGVAYGGLYSASSKQNYQQNIL